MQALDAIDKALQLKPKDPKVVSELFFTKGNQLREQNLLDKAFEVQTVNKIMLLNSWIKINSQFLMKHIQ